MAFPPAHAVGFRMIPHRLVFLLIASFFIAGRPSPLDGLSRPLSLTTPLAGQVVWDLECVCSWAVVPFLGASTSLPPSLRCVARAEDDATAHRTGWAMLGTSFFLVVSLAHNRC